MSQTLKWIVISAGALILITLISYFIRLINKSKAYKMFSETPKEEAWIYYRFLKEPYEVGLLLERICKVSLSINIGRRVQNELIDVVKSSYKGTYGPSSHNRTIVETIVSAKRSRKLRVRELIGQIESSLVTLMVAQSLKMNHNSSYELYGCAIYSFSDDKLEVKKLIELVRQGIIESDKYKDLILREVSSIEECAEQGLISPYVVELLKQKHPNRTKILFQQTLDNALSKHLYVKLKLAETQIDSTKIVELSLAFRTYSMALVGLHCDC